MLCLYVHQHVTTQNNWMNLKYDTHIMPYYNCYGMNSNTTKSSPKKKKTGPTAFSCNYKINYSAV